MLNVVKQIYFWSVKYINLILYEHSVQFLQKINSCHDIYDCIKNMTLHYTQYIYSIKYKEKQLHAKNTFRNPMYTET